MFCNKTSIAIKLYQIKLYLQQGVNAFVCDSQDCSTATIQRNQNPKCDQYVLFFRLNQNGIQ